MHSHTGIDEATRLTFFLERCEGVGVADNVGRLLIGLAQSSPPVNDGNKHASGDDCKFVASAAPALACRQGTNCHPFSFPT
jgi:hypothetical protein